VWVIVKDQRLIFKADIQAETPEVIYLEGVYVSPKARGLVKMNSTTVSGHF
jgi:predicted GNAT family acetyltransferase